MSGRIASLFGAQDMTRGKPMSCLIRFSIPLLIGNFAQQLYSTVDSIIVGKYVGDGALAAVGVSNPIINLLLVLFVAISTGAGIMVSQYFGAREKERLSQTVGTSILLILISSAVITLIGVFMTPSILTWLSTPADIYDMARDYLVIVFWGIVGSAFYNILSGILRGLGDAMWPLVFLLITTVLNIFLDIWFVAGLGWGVAGAAWATILSQAISAVLCLIRVFSMRETVALNRNTLRWKNDIAGTLMRLGMPAGLTQGIFSMAMMLVQALANTMGAQVVAMTTAVMRVDGFAMLPNFTFGMAAATFVGQNIGANQMARVERGTKDSFLLATLVSSLLTLMLILFGHQLVMLFTSTAEIVEMGARAFRILAFGYIAMGILQVYSGVMRGAGDTLPSMWISVFTTVLLRTPVAYLMAYLTRSEAYPAGSPDSLYWSLLISWCTGALLNYLWYRRGKWREKSLIRRGPDDE